MNVTKVERGFSTPLFQRAVNFDRTPSDLHNLRKIQDFLQDAEIVGLIKHLYENADVTWAVENPECAKQFFYEPYPQVAVDQLGYCNGPAITEESSDSTVDQSREAAENNNVKDKDTLLFSQLDTKD